MLFEFSVLLRCPSLLKYTKRHLKLRRNTATTSMTRWSFPLHWKLDARLSIPKTFTMARQLIDNSPFEIPSLDHPASNLYNFKSRYACGTLLQDLRTRTSERAVFRQRSQNPCVQALPGQAEERAPGH